MKVYVRLYQVLLLVAAILHMAVSDYTCLCNYNVELNVYTSPSTSSTEIGYMYEFDCKPLVTDAKISGWVTIAFEKKMGYIEDNPNVNVQLCTGGIPTADKIEVQSTVTSQSTIPQTSPTTTATTSPITSPTSQTTTTTSPITSTTSPTTTTSPMTSPTSQTTTATSPMTLPTFSMTSPTSRKTSSTSPQTSSSSTTTATPSHITSTTSSTTTTTKSPISSSSSPKTTPTSVITSQTSPMTSSTFPETSSPSTTTTPPSPITSTTSLTTTSKSQITSSSSPQTTRTSTITSQTTSHMTSSTSPMSTQTSSMSRTTASTTITTKVSITLPASTSPIPDTKVCPPRVVQSAEETGSQLTQYESNCYEVSQEWTSWPAAESHCNCNGGHLIHIANHNEQDFIYKFLVTIKSHTVWIGFHDRLNESNFEWTSGSPVTYTNWSPDRTTYLANVEDCGYITHTGEWNDARCDTIGYHHGYICQYGAVSTGQAPDKCRPMPNSYNISYQLLYTKVCPPRVVQSAKESGSQLTQSERYCYVVSQKLTGWPAAESHCSHNGGHLIHIANQNEQDFIYKFLVTIKSYTVWIGFHDRLNESNFEWTSGSPVTYTNWSPDRTTNLANDEDCGYITRTGEWNDAPCDTIGYHHGYICQYEMSR